MRIEQLQIILEVARTGSISQAARNLSLSQPSLSAAVASLERELGLKLFNRSSRGMTPTPSGQEVLEIVESFNQELARIWELLPENDRQPEQIQVLAIPSACNSILLEAIAQFRQLYPDVQVVITQCRPPALLERLAQSSDAIGIVGYNHIFGDKLQQMLGEGDFTNTFLYHDAFYHMVSGANPLAQLDEAPLSAFYEGTIVYFADTVFTQPEQLYADMGLFLPSMEQKPESVITVTSLEATKRLVACDCGTALMPRTALYGDIYAQSGRLKALRISDMHLEFNHHLLYHKHFQPTEATQTLIGIIKHIYYHLTLD